MRTSGSSIETTLFDRAALSSAPIVLPTVGGLAMTMSVLLRCVSVVGAYPGSIRGRLITDVGEPSACGLPLEGERLSNSGDKTVLRSGRVMSACACGLSGECCGTEGQVAASSGFCEALAGRLSCESSIARLERGASCCERGSVEGRAWCADTT
jgi:hypothetical protein